MRSQKAQKAQVCLLCRFCGLEIILYPLHDPLLDLMKMVEGKHVIDVSIICVGIDRDVG